MFQGGGVVFQMGGASFLSEGGSPWGALVLVGRGVEKNCKMGGTPSRPLWETLHTMGMHAIFQKKGKKVKKQQRRVTMRFYNETNRRTWILLF